MGQEHHTHEFVATYTRKDAILYALAIGFGSNEATYEQDLPYVYEHHEDFSIVPSFNTALFFSARQPNEMNSVLPTFPPAIMKSMGILPRNHLREKVLGFDSLPVLHIMQRITWHDERGELLTPPNHHTPASVNLHSSFRSITPKEIGTYVVLSTQLFQEDHSVCEVESTFLVLGLDPAVVIPMKAPPSRRDEPLRPPVVWDGAGATVAPPSHEERVHMGWNTSLLYRMASGDTNALHVYGTSWSGNQPIVHGLWTLGHVTRILLQNNRNFKLRLLEIQFVGPIRLGDTIVVKVWNQTPEPARVFLVCTMGTDGEIEVARGCAVLSSSSSSSSSSVSNETVQSRL